MFAESGYSLFVIQNGYGACDAFSNIPVLTFHINFQNCQA